MHCSILECETAGFGVGFIKLLSMPSPAFVILEINGHILELNCIKGIIILSVDLA